MNEQQRYIYTIEYYDEGKGDYTFPVVLNKASTWKRLVKQTELDGGKCRACRWRRDDVQDMRKPKKRRRRL